MNPHKSGTVTWTVIMALIAMLIACSSCSSSIPYGARPTPSAASAPLWAAGYHQPQPWRLRHALWIT
jgi:hypothetical protein